MLLVTHWGHFANSPWVQQRVRGRVVMEVGGWSDRSMLDRYEPVNDEHVDEFVERMIARYPTAGATGIVRLPVRSKFAGPHSPRKGAVLEAAPG
jgi:hypothetical protein